MNKKSDFFPLYRIFLFNLTAGQCDKVILVVVMGFSFMLSTLYFPNIFQISTYISVILFLRFFHTLIYETLSSLFITIYYAPFQPFQQIQMYA